MIENIVSHGGRRKRRSGARSALVIGAAGALGAGLLALSTPAVAASTLGASAAERGRHFGAGVLAARLGESDYATVLNREFTMVTPENEMKWDAVEPARDSFTYATPDRIVSSAQSHDQQVRGHTLVWHSGLPAWVANLQSADDLRAAMNNHITNVMNHYKGQIYAWDVVNEAFQDGTGGARRDSLFQRRLGDGFIEEAFRTARAADPAAKLCYNDYNIDDAGQAKTRAVYDMVKDFRSRGVPIDCVGLQSHFSGQTPVPGNYRQNIERFAALGVDVQITQLDVEGAGSAQADGYRKVVDACLAVSRCTGITVWGVTDKYSWRGSATPLLFDADYGKKPAYDAVLAALNSDTPPPSSPPPSSPPPSSPPPTGGRTCGVTATTLSQWHGGYVVQPVRVTNTGASPITSWTVTFTLPPGHAVTRSWNASPTTSGRTVTVRNTAANGSLGGNAGTTFGFQGSRPRGDASVPSGYTCTAS
ncbi:endo-1,4-beta-xylanase [Sphaerisporangium dianthi]|uniref:Beta-xylanase n=1 Tax=Sphaerisporangium dianthi TaxID=1436120 RepID=A0ABV9CUT8_9ACTN